jgi:plastocyanin
MAQVMIEITRDAQGQVVFKPNPAVVTTQDNVFWVNNDTEPHLPTRTDGTAPDQKWMNYEIPLGASSSGVVFFDPDTITGKAPTYTVEYFCCVHSDTTSVQPEKGTITVES